MAELLSIWPNCTHPYGWVRKVAWHKYLRAADRARRQAEGEARAGAPSAPVCEDPGEVAWVREILLGLPARQRAVMALYVDGYSIPEIAALLKMEVSTARSNLRHARTTLRRMLEGPPPKNKS
ncbi:sigma-70 family RNA polymerase sigma factor [Streptomyces sp. NPDC047082]|uniref:RNA polymerase sigma factor n=1 Tax=Streptomyces sp. NPDC047082 TaxID=3155259 RepID=UPI0033F71317